MKKTGKILKAFLRERAVLFGAYLCIVLIFLAVSALYGYENSLTNMLYAAWILLFAGLLAAAFDFGRYYKRSRQLIQALSKKGESDYFLPEPATLEQHLYQEMIRQTEKEKRQLITELDERKRDMADYYTMWTHQIKTPIAGMKLLLQKGCDREEQEETAEAGKIIIWKQALSELFKIEEYSEMALNYARLESLSSDLVFRSHELYEIAKNAVKKYSILFIGSGISLSMEEFSLKAVTDQKWIGFVIEQILSNAIKYTSKGSIKIYIQDDNRWDAEGCKNRAKAGKQSTQRERTEQQRTEQEPKWIFLVVEDNGIGISESDLPRIYERGFTGYNGRAGQRSTGIGLYLCKEICDRLGCRIRVESVISKGTKVFLGFWTNN